MVRASHLNENTEKGREIPNDLCAHSAIAKETECTNIAAQPEKKKKTVHYFV